MEIIMTPSEYMALSDEEREEIKDVIVIDLRGCAFTFGFLDMKIIK